MAAVPRPSVQAVHKEKGCSVSIDPSSDIRSIAGFWRRLGAFFLDCLLLGSLGAAVGSLLTDELVHMGPWGRLLGFFVALFYFGLLNSSLTGGQTIGKRLLKIKVVNKDGGPLSVPMSFLRFVPIGAPWFLNNAQFSDTLLFSAWVYALSVAIFGLGLSILYLYIFNRRSRQSVHDLLVGSYVVAVKAKGRVVATTTSRLHLGICVFLIGAAGVVPFYAKNLASSEPFAPLMKITAAVRSEPWVVFSTVSKGQTSTATAGAGQKTTTHLSITAHSKDADIQNASRAQQLATLAIAADSSVGGVDVMDVTLVYGYDIGIASYWRSQRHTRTPAAWGRP